MGEGTEGRFSTSRWTAPSRLSNLEENPGAEWNQERAREPRSWEGDPGLESGEPGREAQESGGRLGWETERREPVKAGPASGRRLPSRADDQQQRALGPAESMWLSVLLRRLKGTARRARHSEAPPPASRMTRRAGRGGRGGQPRPRSTDPGLERATAAWEPLLGAGHSFHTSLETLEKSSLARTRRT